MLLTPTLVKEYVDRFSCLMINSARKNEIDTVARRITSHRSKYEAVEAATQIPWYLIGILHQLESSGSFTKHLHNGDSLTARTVQVPKGRPKHGTPPFTWVESAIDALDEVAHYMEWTIPRLLHTFEAYNGWGYRKKSINIPSPYLWAGSQHYVAGKYVADGKWSPTAVSKQIGAAVLLKMLMHNGAIHEVIA